MRARILHGHGAGLGRRREEEIVMKALLSLLAALAPWTVWAGAAGGPTGTIPEPSTIALLAAGAVGVALAARRRR